MEWHEPWIDSCQGEVPGEPFFGRPERISALPHLVAAAAG